LTYEPCRLTKKTFEEKKKPDHIIQLASVGLECRNRGRPASSVILKLRRRKEKTAHKKRKRRKLLRRLPTSPVRQEKKGDRERGRPSAFWPGEEKKANAGKGGASAPAHIICCAREVAQEEEKNKGQKSENSHHSAPGSWSRGKKGKLPDIERKKEAPITMPSNSVGSLASSKRER